jgi:hypothetical protein
MVGGNFSTQADLNCHCFKEEEAIGTAEYFKQSTPMLLLVTGKGLEFILLIV